jgi:hypothetical protein
MNSKQECCNTEVLCVRLHCSPEADWPLKMKTEQSFKSSAAAHSETLCHSPEELNPEQHRCGNLETLLDNAASSLYCCITRLIGECGAKSDW